MKYKNIKITKRTDNRWQARIKYQGKYKYIYGKTQLECLNKLKNELKYYKLENVKRNKYTLTQWLDKWQELYKENKVSIGTKQIYKNLRNKYIDKLLGHYEIEKITALKIMEFLNSIQAKRQKEKVYTLLHDAFNKATINKIIKDNPMLIVEKPKHEKKQNRAFTIQEELNFIEQCKLNNYGDYFLVTLFQGLRKSETLNIYINDVDFENNKLSINQKEDKRYRIKTKQSIRTIPLFNRTKSILEKHKNAVGRIFNISQKKIYEEFSNICKKSNIQNATIHTLRHTFITRCIENNIPLKIVQQWAGHSTSKMTNEVYTHINKEFEDKYINQFDTLFDTFFKDKKNKWYKTIIYLY